VETWFRREYDLTRYYAIRAALINSMGSKCVDCSSTENLEFDHVNKDVKSFDVSKNLFRPMPVLNEELTKCVLRCRVCHKRKSDAEKSVEHGGGRSGKRNCKCELCKKRKAEYMKIYKQSYKKYGGPKF
jgi:5-methylcytosine-specific restriction endonuclease McrA